MQFYPPVNEFECGVSHPSGFTLMYCEDDVVSADVDWVVHQSFHIYFSPYINDCRFLQEDFKKYCNSTSTWK